MGDAQTIVAYTRFVYVPKTSGHTCSAEDERLQGIIYEIKDGRGGWANRTSLFAKYVVESCGDLTGCSLVPVPQSTPRKHSGPLELAKALAATSQQANVVECIQRDKPRQASSAGGSRSIRSHLDTLKYVDAGALHPSVVLVDDVMTTGGQFAAAADTLRLAGYHGEIFAVAVARTLGPGVTRDSRNHVWKVSWSDGDTTPQVGLVSSETDNTKPA